MNPFLLGITSVTMIIIRSAVCMVQAALFCLAAYIGALVFAGLLPRRSSGRRATPGIYRSFAVLIPAKDEQDVIAQCLRSLAAQDYPRAKSEWFVVADNCSDTTADVARAHGATTYERSESGAGTKGAALRFLFDGISAAHSQYQAYLVLDADNVVRPTFLQEVNSALDAGCHVVQSQRAVKNPKQNWLTGLESINHGIRYLEQSGRARLRLPCMLHGSGMAFSNHALRILGGWPTSLEDTEAVQALCVLKGLHIAWCPDAVVYDEQVSSLGAFCMQRERWRAGQKQAFLGYFGRLLASGTTQRDVRKLEQALYLARLQLPLSLLTFGALCLEALALTPAAQYLGLSAHIWAFVLLLLGTMVLGGAVTVDAAPVALLGVLAVPMIVVLSVGITVKAWAASSVDWAKTKHGAAVDARTPACPPRRGSA